jgi:DNA-binding SARP family transcriptional activator
VQIGILGPFEVRAGDGALADVPGARLRALLVALALEPGRVVSKAALINWIWGEQPPADADLAVRLGRYEQAARLLAASVGLRGQPDRSSPDAARIEQAARRHLGEARFAEVTLEGAQASGAELVEATFAS